MTFRAFPHLCSGGMLAAVSYVSATGTLALSEATMGLL